MMKHFISKITVLIIGATSLFSFTNPVSAQVTVADLFTDNMVLQQNRYVNVWGWAKTGETVSVSGNWNNRTVTAVTAADGKWVVKLPTPKANKKCTPYNLIIKGSNTIELKNVLIGEVWLLSGQSNMELPLKGWKDAPIEGSDKVISEANYPNIRFIMTGKANSATPMTQLPKAYANATWTRCAPESVRDFSALGYFFGKELNIKLNIPIGLVLSAYGGSSCEAWMNKASLEKVDEYKGKGPWTPQKEDDNRTPGVLFNAMIAPIVPFTFAGVLWYQGETNVGRAAELTRLFPAMIEGWRADFGNPKLPIYYVQLCPWDGYWGTSLPEFWEAQSYALKLPNTAMIGTLDVGDSANIHPSKKEPIGHRFAWCALVKNYGNKKIEYSGPQYKSSVVERDGIRVYFTHANKGLKLAAESTPQFEIAGIDSQFVPAKVKIEGQTIYVWSENVKTPKYVRYAWSRNAKAALLNVEGLPALPFRTALPDYMLR